MATACPSLSPDGPYLSGMLDYIDCQAQVIGENGYRALASPASSLSPLLTLALTIFVALIGYRILVGDLPRPREAVIAALKVGVVLMLATSWPSFRTLAYDVTMRGPAQLAQTIGEPAGLPGAAGGLNARLQGIDEAIAELMVRGAGFPNGPGASFDQSNSASLWIPFDPTRDREMLATARSTFLASTIGAYASVRLVAGFLLALGPIFALFLLFNGTRGLFEGWIRGLVGAALGATAISVILAVQIALMEPWLASILSARRSEISTPTVPVELFVAVVVFALVLLAALFAIFRIASSFRIPQIQVPVQWVESQFSRTNRSTSQIFSSEAGPRQSTRAMKVVDAISASQRRENGNYQTGSALPTRAALVAGSFGGRSARRNESQRRSLETRRTQSRHSSRAQKRDRG